MIIDRIKQIFEPQMNLDEIPPLDLSQAATNCLFNGANPRQEILNILVNRSYLAEGTVLPTLETPNPKVDKLVNDLTQKLYKSF